MQINISEVSDITHASKPGKYHNYAKHYLSIVGFF